MIYILIREQEEDFHAPYIDFLWASTDKDEIADKYDERIADVEFCDSVHDQCYATQVAKKKANPYLPAKEYHDIWKPYWDLANQGHNPYAREHEFCVMCFLPETGEWRVVTEDIKELLAARTVNDENSNFWHNRDVRI